MRRFACLTALGLAFFSQTAIVRGDVILFDNRADFDGATSGRTMIDFEGIAPDGQDVLFPCPPGITLSGVNFITTNGAAGGFGVAGKGADNFKIFPGNSVMLSGQQGLDPDIVATLSGSYLSFGVDFTALALGTETTFMLSTGDSFTRTTTSDLSFVGLLSTDPFTEVTISIPPPGFGPVALFIDNFTFGDEVFATPEPASWIMSALGGGAMVGFSRWRTRRCSVGRGLRMAACGIALRNSSRFKCPEDHC
jgi:hypothetical protein